MESEQREANIFSGGDADDYADKHLLAKTLPLLESDADVVIYGTQYFWENGGRADNRIRKNIMDKINETHCLQN